MLVEPLMTQVKRDNYDVQDSITEFFMYDCECPKSSNGCYHWNFVALKCRVCKKASPMPLKCGNSEVKTCIYQFETTEKPYQKVNKDGTITEKISAKTERVEHILTFGEIYNKLQSLKKTYTSHKYQVFNDQFHSPKILFVILLAEFITWIILKIFFNNINLNHNLAILISHSIDYIVP